MPLIMEILKILAKKGQLVDMVEKVSLFVCEYSEVTACHAMSIAVVIITKSAIVCRCTNKVINLVF